MYYATKQHLVAGSQIWLVIYVVIHSTCSQPITHTQWNVVISGPVLWLRETLRPHLFSKKDFIFITIYYSRLLIHLARVTYCKHTVNHLMHRNKVVALFFSTFSEVLISSNRSEIKRFHWNLRPPSLLFSIVRLSGVLPSMNVILHLHHHTYSQTAFKSFKAFVFFCYSAIAVTCFHGQKAAFIIIMTVQTVFISSKNIPENRIFVNQRNNHLQMANILQNIPGI
jgi:hypothetical protein